MKLPVSICRFVWKQSWLPLSSKKSVYRALNKAGESMDAPFETEFFGLKYEGNLKNGIEFALFYYGAFEKPLLFFLRDTFAQLKTEHGERCVFCDIGANIGQHSLFMSNYSSGIHAFEPFAPVRGRLEHHIALNSLNNITVHPLGLGQETKTEVFYAPEGSNQGIGSFIEESQSKGNTAIGELQLANGDEYFEQQQITDAKLVKIDVEGLEKEVIHGLSKTFTSQRPVIACEISYEESRSFASLEELLASLPSDYSIYRFDTRKADGSTAKRRGSRAKRTGSYRLIPMETWYEKGQDDLVFVPNEFLPQLPLQNLTD